MIDGVSETGKLTASAAAETLLPEGLPVSLAYLDVVCTALGGGLCDPVAEVGVSVLGSTGMHMRYAPTPDDVRLNEDRSGYTMCLPIGRACSSMQSNMAATLNIDWLMDMAREAAEMAGARTSRAALLSGLDERVLAPTPARRSTTLIFSKLASAVLSSIRTRGRNSAAFRRRRVSPASRARSLKASHSRRATATSLPARFRAKSGWAEAPRGRRRCAPFLPRLSTRTCGHSRARSLALPAPQ